MFRKVLVANRGEIAVRAFRAATELGITTVAVFPYEDRKAEYRLKADEAYQIGEEGHPVRAYLDVKGIVKAAKEAGADAIYPGYGFLSENPDLAQRCEEEGITFVGPAHTVLELTGNKARAIKAAEEAGLPILHDSEPSNDVATLVAASEEIGFPLFVKAVSGGGGRGMRKVDSPEALEAAIVEAQREAGSAFGDDRMYLEEAVVSPRHIEVQILADATGETIHLFERDCSVQRRHQKVVEVAPAPNLDPELRDRMCADAVRFARQIGSVNAGTVEFLLGPAGRYVFIEMNPRIQVEHTVTEEVTDVDLVSSQLRIAAGETLAELGLAQDSVRLRGAALQCRITTEDPSNGFRPDTGRIMVYRSPGGAGVRLDGGTVFDGAEVGAHFDSMLVKLTCRGRDFATAVQRAQRALQEFRIRGISTNITFLESLISDPDFIAGRITTSFIEERPSLFDNRMPADRGTKLLTYLAGITVNQPHGPQRTERSAREKLPHLPEDVLRAEPPAGSRQQLLDLGPEGWARALRERTSVAVTDTTFRDAHQSLLATRVRTRDMLHVAPYVAHMLPQLLSVEAWGGATYDVALRFLLEDPWERLAKLHEAMPNLPIQMLLRGRNTVGYTPYPLSVTNAFVAEAARTGVDVFRIFDALNNVDQMRPAIEAVRETDHAVAEAALCYTGNMLSPGEQLYTLDYYLRLAEQLVEAGAHVLAIKDMAGLLRAPAAAQLVRALRERFDGGATPTPPPPGGPRPRRAGRRAPRASTRWTWRRPRWPAPPPRSRCPRWSRPPTAPTGPPGSTSTPSWTSSPTGRPSAGSTVRSSLGSPARPVASTPTRSPAGSCPTCASRRSRSGSATGSRPSRTCTPPPTGSSATSSRSPRRPRSWATSRSRSWVRARTRRRSRRTRRSSTYPTRSSASSTATSAPRPAAGPSRSAPRPSRAGGPSPSRPSCPARTSRPSPTSLG